MKEYRNPLLASERQRTNSLVNSTAVQRVRGNEAHLGEVPVMRSEGNPGAQQNQFWKSLMGPSDTHEERMSLSIIRQKPLLFV